MALGYAVYSIIQTLRHVIAGYDVTYMVPKLLNHVIMAFTWITVLWTQENMLLGNVVVILSCDVILKHLLAITKIVFAGNRKSRTVIIAGIILILVTQRLFVPISLMSVGFYSQAVSNLTPVSLALLFAMLVFFLSYSIWTVYTCVRSASSYLWRRCQNPGGPGEVTPSDTGSRRSQIQTVHLPDLLCSTDETFICNTQAASPETKCCPGSTKRNQVLPGSGLLQSEQSGCHSLKGKLLTSYQTPNGSIYIFHTKDTKSLKRNQKSHIGCVMQTIKETEEP